MLFYTVGQSQVFLMMLYVGLGVGAWYSSLEILRRLTQAGPLLSLGLDMVFGAGAAALMIAGALRVSYGELRLYAVLGVLCGAWIFRGAVLPPARCMGRLLKRGWQGLCRRPHPLLQKIFR